MSAALFTAENGFETAVFDTDGTWMHKAHLFNYPGIGSIGGTEFIGVLRQQVDDFGVDRRQGTEVTDVTADGDGFTVTTAEGEHESAYLVLATGADRSLAADLGCATTDEDVVDVGVEMETSVADAYATGAMVRAEEWRAVIAAGDGAAAALHILSKRKGEHYHDFDVPADAEAAFGGMIEEA